MSETILPTLPKWLSEGIEPPEDLKVNGWSPGTKPPAQYMDWLFNSIYKCLDDLYKKTGDGDTQQKLEEIEAVLGNFEDIETEEVTNIVEAIADLRSKVTQHLDDYEYQTPTISGTQIRLTKQSNTNRLLFKLDSSLSGSITVSTDSGTTSKNLVDIDGSPVTSMEKGFHEIVLTGNFFILRNKGGLSKADLEALITITNEAEANESVLRTNYVNAVNGADESINLTSNATWNDILLQIPQLTQGKIRTNVMSITSNPTNTAIVKSDGTNQQRPHLIIDLSQIPFVPRMILFFQDNKETPIVTVWNNENHYYISDTDFGNCAYSSTAYRVPYENGPITIPVANVNRVYTCLALS